MTCHFNPNIGMQTREIAIPTMAVFMLSCFIGTIVFRHLFGEGSEHLCALLGILLFTGLAVVMLIKASL